MTSISARSGVGAFLGIMLCTPALGQTTAPAPRSGSDSNEIVCEKQSVIGSRLQTRRVCHTRAEWADLRKQDREELEHKQTERGMRAPG